MPLSNDNGSDIFDCGGIDVVVGGGTARETDSDSDFLSLVFLDVRVLFAGA